MAVRIGCSGFLYEHWRGRLYHGPDRGAELEAYARIFDTVELNVTFYRMPSSATFRSWAARVPEGFTFAVKASRYLTHIRRLQDPRDAVDFLMERSSELGPHLGPILLQLPPDFQLDLDRLVATLDAFPGGTRLAVEPRHRSWFTEEVRQALEDRGVALCLADRRGPVTPTWHTADWGYLRFHGGRATPGSCYGEQALESWAQRLRETWGPRPAGYVYFNNDFHGCALRDAGVFGRALVAAGVDVARVPAVDPSIVEEPGDRLRSA